MNSEEEKLKSTDKRESKKINEEEDKETNINDDLKDQKNIFVPSINTRNIPFFAVSILNYFAIGISLVIFAFINKEWFKTHLDKNKEFFVKYYLVSGIVLYVIGIFDWYEGKELIYLIDFIFSFYFISLFLKEKEIGDITQDCDNDKLHGTFYIIFFALFFFVAVSSKNKGPIYILDYAVLFLGYFFLFIYKYIQKDWIKDIYSYIFIISGVFYWITGFLKLFDSNLDFSIKILRPTD